MPNRADVNVAATQTALEQFSGAGTQYLVQTSAGVLYLVYVDDTSDVSFKKSTDGGLSWTAPTEIFAGTVTALSVWYDRWSNISAGLIHLAYTESGTDDTLYRTINTESSDALSTQTVIFAGATTGTGGCLSICRARGGNVYCATMIDAGAEGGFFRLLNANVPNGAWDAARATVFEAISLDQIILVPGWAADNQDMMAFFWDSSADEISRKLYDDSANSWAETSIATSMADQVAATAFPHFAAAVDIANSRNLLVAWNGVDTLNADLRCWTITESAITEVTNVVLNSTDDQGLCGICIDLQTTGKWSVVYGGKSDGSETFLTSINLYHKISLDSGTTWGPESLLTTMTSDITWLCTVPRLNVGPMPVAYHRDAAQDNIACNVCFLRPQAAYQLVGG